MRETKAQLAQRVEADNVGARGIPVGTTVETEFGPTVLGENLGPTADSGDWDVYRVWHSGFMHRWTSAIIVPTFGEA